MANTFVTDNNFFPSITNEIYVPDTLIYDTRLVVTQGVTLAAAQGVLSRGTVLGQQTIGSATAVAGTNTGTGTCSAVTLNDTNVMTGVYKVRFSAATVFQVTNPQGDVLSTIGATGTAFADQIGFTITASGTAFVAGDTFAITVAAGSGSYIPSVSGAKDGSGVPSAILIATLPNNTGTTTGCPVYVAGEFNAYAVIFDGSWGAQSSGTLIGGQGQALPTGFTAGLAVLTPLLQNKNITLRTPISAIRPGYATN